MKPKTLVFTLPIAMTHFRPMCVNSIAKFLAALILLPTALALSVLAEDPPGAGQKTFVSGAYVRYQNRLKPDDKLAEAAAGGTAYVDGLLDTIEAPMPDADLWLRKAAVYANPAAITQPVMDRLVANGKHHSAQYANGENLKQLVDQGFHFTPDQIDRMLRGFDHPDPGVVQQLHNALVQTFGVWFVEGEQWVYKPENVRKKYKAAWRNFWSQNRDRYGRNLPLIINDLSLDATPVRTNGAICLQVVITNHGTNDWDILTEVPGSADTPSRLTPGSWQNIYTLMMGETRVDASSPKAYVIASSPTAPSPEKLLSTPDRPVHLERITIPAGTKHNYLFDLSKAFPQLDLHQKEVVLRYSMPQHNTPPDIWRGELRSVPVKLE
jgi:hypothetical protein